MLSSKTIGNRIADARKKVAISQAELADQLFISSQAVGKWERGESLPDILMLNRLAEIFGVDLNYFSENFQSVAGESNPVVNIAVASNSEAQNTTIGTSKRKLPWDMSSGNWVDADFSGLNSLTDKFSSSNMKNCKFIGSDLSGLKLKSNNVDGCDFSNSNINNSFFQSSNLGNNQFKGCSLIDTEFSSSNIGGCDFSDANLTGATFKTSTFSKNTMVNTIWNRTSFSAMQLDEVVFEGKLEDCSFENCAFYRVVFQNVTLTNVFFKNNKNLKRIKFVDCQVDRMTYAFLQNGKADVSGITLLP